MKTQERTTIIPRDPFQEILLEEVAYLKRDHPEIFHDAQALSAETLHEMAHAWAFSRDDELRYTNLASRTADELRALLFPEE